MKSKFNFSAIVLLAINSIIGTGIFLSPAGVVKIAGVYTPLVYLLAASFAALLAITFASAAKYVNKNGASYAYAQAAFGDNVGFYVGITLFVAAAIAWGVMATAVVRTTISIFFGSAAATDVNITIGFLILMGILLLISFAGTYVTKIASNISTVGKISALILAFGAGLWIFMSTGQNNFFEINNVVDASGAKVVQPMDITLFVSAMLSAFYAYTGFESVASAASEMEKPERNLPKALPLAILIIAIIYMSVVTIAMIIDPDALLNTTNPVVLAGAFEKYPIIMQLITYGAVLSMFGINIAAAFSSPRILEAMTLQGQLPKIFAYRSKTGIPIYAFLTTALIAIVIPMSFNYNMRGIMIISSISRFIQFLVVPIAVVCFYYNRSKAPLIKTKKNYFTDVLIPILAFITSVFLLANFDWKAEFSIVEASGVTKLNWYAISAMLVGYVVVPIILYLPYQHRKKQLKKEE